jgi:hypothetical protein
MTKKQKAEKAKRIAKRKREKEERRARRARRLERLKKLLHKTNNMEQLMRSPPVKHKKGWVDPNEEVPDPGTKPRSIMEEAKETAARLVARMKPGVTDPIDSFCEWFNSGDYSFWKGESPEETDTKPDAKDAKRDTKNDFMYARKDPKTGHWRPLDWPKRATHKLIATSWYDDEEEIKRQKGRRAVFHPTGHEGKALSVAAIPLKIKLRKGVLRITRTLPRSAKRWPVYRVDWIKLSKKHQALRTFATMTGCVRRYSKRIKALTHAECDAMAREFIRSSRWLRMQNRKNGDGKQFWSKFNEETKKEPTT